LVGFLIQEPHDLSLKLPKGWDCQGIEKNPNSCLPPNGWVQQFFNTKGIKTGGDDGGPTTNHRWFRGVKARIVPDMSDNFQPYSG